MENLVWIDMEMTGLNVETDKILEVACIITKSDLQIISEVNIIIHESEDMLNSMNEWCMQYHISNNLATESRKSTVTLQEAEKLLLDFLKMYIPEKSCPLAGNSVYMDRIFLAKYMPLVNEYLHYRIVDVSTIKELARRWCPTTYKNGPGKELKHRALSDIKESIKELLYYRESFFKQE